MKLFRVLLVLLALLGLGLSARAATVVLDAGHGGHDRGGVPGQRYSEKALTLSVARRVASKLQSAGYRVVMTRNSDTFVGLGERCRIANRYGDIFVSIHFNSAPRKTASGVETYYYSGKSARLAASLHREILGVMNTENRGLRRRGFYVIRNTRIPAVLLESGFLTNASEGRRLYSSSMQDRLSSAIVRGIQRGR